MRKLSFLAACAVAAGGLLSLVVAVQPASAFHAPFPTKARNYKAWMVRAMDECSPATLSVLGIPTLPTGGCLQSNVVTDEMPPTDPVGATMNFARVSVSRFPAGGGQGRVSLFGVGFQPGQRVRVLLTLRTTRKNLITKHPPGTNRVTFEDVTVVCGSDGGSPPCFSARPSGKIAGSMTLTQCLTNNGVPTGLAGGNVEIVEAALENCDTGKILARPGILD